MRIELGLGSAHAVAAITLAEAAGLLVFRDDGRTLVMTPEGVDWCNERGLDLDVAFAGPATTGMAAFLEVYMDEGWKDSQL